MQHTELTKLLLDSNAELGVRDDAAMDLYNFDETSVEEALLRIILDRHENEILIDSAGESLSEIWKRKGKSDDVIVSKMPLIAQKYFEAV